MLKPLINHITLLFISFSALASTAYLASPFDQKPQQETKAS
jgi:hypothetical protein